MVHLNCETLKCLIKGSTIQYKKFFVIANMYTYYAPYLTPRIFLFIFIFKLLEWFDSSHLSLFALLWCIDYMALLGTSSCAHESLLKYLVTPAAAIAVHQIFGAVMLNHHLTRTRHASAARQILHYLMEHSSSEPIRSMPIYSCLH